MQSHDEESNFVQLVEENVENRKKIEHNIQKQQNIGEHDKKI